MGPRHLCFVLFFFLCGKEYYTNAAATTGRRTRRQSNTYGTTNFDINESVKRLEKSIRGLENKLSRHEFREAQVADFSTKALNALTADHGLTEKKLTSVTKQLTSMEERMMSMEAFISTVDERQRNKLDAISEGLNRLLISKPKFDLDFPPPGSNIVGSVGGSNTIEKDLKKILRRVNVIDDAFRRQIKNLDNEVKIVGESLGQHMKQLNNRQDRIWSDWNTCQKEQINSLTEVSNSLTQTGSLFTEQIAEAKRQLNKGGKSNGCDSLTKEVTAKLDSLERVYHHQEREMTSLTHNTQTALQDQKLSLQHILKETQNEKSLLQNYFSDTFDGFTELDTQSKKHLGDLEATLKNIMKENSQEMRKRLHEVSSTLKDKTHNIINALDDTASMSENMQSTMTESFDDLTKDIRGLKKVEQVMLNTADAVLDTKRSIEFGIQQVILELSDTVKNSGKNIDSTLSDHISNISFAILKNQTTALTNMTSKMENEISQVWRQIGVMYQQIAQSVNILGELKTTTSQQMNASLDKVGTMDGTVGAINNKVADVEDNLNYLLGKLSLVVSEFSQMKSGVGEELQKLREMAQEFSGDNVIEYQVKRKRNVPNGDHFSDDRKTSA